MGPKIYQKVWIGVIYLLWLCIKVNVYREGMAACYFSVNGDNERTRNEFWGKKFWMNTVPLGDMNEGVEMSRGKKKRLSYSETPEWMFDVL